MAKLSDFELALGGKRFKPLVVGGMGVDISTVELALGAARLGGVGHISDAMMPYVCDKIFGTCLQEEKGRNIKALRQQGEVALQKWLPEVVRESSRKYVLNAMERKVGDGAIFVNVMEKLTMGAPLDTLQARIVGALDGGIDGITLSAGLHTSSLRLVEDHPRFRDVMFGIIVSSLRAFKIFLRSARRVNRMPDYVVVEGPLAGGHLGFGPDWNKYNLYTIVSEVVEFLRKENLNIVVIPAGGVFTGTDAVDCIELGAGAVQVATRFTISQECGLSDPVKQHYIKAGEEDVEVNTSSPTGYCMRMLRTSPSLKCRVSPQCDTLGYLLDSKGCCQYKHSYANGPVDEKGYKLPLSEKMCICYYFMRNQCYTCGHYVYRLKETTRELSDGKFYLPTMEHIFNDYMDSVDYSIRLPEVREPSNPSASGTGDPGYDETAYLKSIRVVS